MGKQSYNLTFTIIYTGDAYPEPPLQLTYCGPAGPKLLNRQTMRMLLWPRSIKSPFDAVFCVC